MKSWADKLFRDTYSYRHVVYSIVRSTLKQRYRRSILGFMWTVLAPLLHYLVIGVVFSAANKIQMQNYFVFMFTGAVYFNVISGVTVNSTMAFIGNEHFIKKIYLPKLIYPLNVVSIELVNFLLSFVALVLLGILFGRLHFSPALFFLPLPIVISFGFFLGVSTLVGIMSVYFRDLMHIIPTVMQAAFFLTPILYPIELLPTQLQFIVKLNPFYYFVNCFRDPIMYQRLPSAFDMAVLTGASVVSLILGMYFLYKYDNKIVFKL
ncbi:MAG: ABC transporter permease [Pseudobdellovibrionaceae bacterium]|nr:MAG: ABC transporter permease [Pseudobdellovibrionaceae bacterium]